MSKTFKTNEVTPHLSIYRNTTVKPLLEREVKLLGFYSNLHLEIYFYIYLSKYKKKN